MVSWTIYLSTALIPFHNPISVRFLFIVLSTLSLFIWLLILKKKNISPSFWSYFIAFFCLNPLLGVGSIVATPDVPLVFFWTLSYFFFLHLIDSGNRVWYFLLGCSLGLGFCSKYHIILFVLGGGLSLLIKKSFYRLKWKGISLTILGGALFSAPVLIWNYQNDWVSFLYQIKHGFGRSYYRFEWTYEYLLGQILILSPFVFIQLFKFNKKTMDQYFSISQLVFFMTSTFKSVVEANWTIAAQPHAILHFVQSSGRQKFKWTLYYWFAIYAIIFIMLLSPKAGLLLRSQLSTIDIQELVPVVRKYHPLYGPNYQISSLLSWETQTLVPKLHDFSRKDFFNDLPQSVPLIKTKIYILKEMDSSWPEALTTAHFKKLESFDNLKLDLYQVTYE